MAVAAPQRMTLTEVREKFLVPKSRLARMSEVSISTMARIDFGESRTRLSTRRKIEDALRELKVPLGTAVEIDWGDDEFEPSGAPSDA